MIISIVTIGIMVAMFVLTSLLWSYTITDKDGNEKPVPRQYIGEVGRIDFFVQNEDPIKANELRRTIFKNRNPKRTREEKRRYHRQLRKVIK